MSLCNFVVKIIAEVCIFIVSCACDYFRAITLSLNGLLSSYTGYLKARAVSLQRNIQYSYSLRISTTFADFAS